MQRGIPFDFISGYKGPREDLIHALAHADYQPQFESFTRLPPELRARIYEHYFAEFKHEP